VLDQWGLFVGAIRIRITASWSFPYRGNARFDLNARRDKGIARMPAQPDQKAWPHRLPCHHVREFDLAWLQARPRQAFHAGMKTRSETIGFLIGKRLHHFLLSYFFSETKRYDIVGNENDVDILIISDKKLYDRNLIGNDRNPSKRQKTINTQKYKA
jgi:hypothetical protein